MVHAQEGWHLELESKDQSLTYKGVFYNMMKGVYSSPDSLMSRESQHFEIMPLFPTSASKILLTSIPSSTTPTIPTYSFRETTMWRDGWRLWTIVFPTLDLPPNPSPEARSSGRRRPLWNPDRPSHPTPSVQTRPRNTWTWSTGSSTANPSPPLRNSPSISFDLGSSMWLHWALYKLQ